MQVNWLTRRQMSGSHETICTRKHYLHGKTILINIFTFNTIVYIYIWSISPPTITSIQYSNFIIYNPLRQFQLVEIVIFGSYQFKITYSISLKKHEKKSVDTSMLEILRIN